MAFLALSLGFLRYLPGMQFTTEVWSLAMSVALLGALRRRLFVVPLALTPTERYALFLIVALPVLGAVSAQRAFGQPVWYGLIAQRGLFQMGAAFLLYEMLVQRRVTMRELEQAFVRLGWLNLVFCSAVLILLDPNDFDDMPNFVTSGGGIYNKFSLPWTFIVFNFFYYTTKGIVTGQKKSSLMSLPFLIYIAFGVGNRTLIAVTALTYLIQVAVWLPWARILPMLSKAVATGLVLMVVVSIVDPGKLGELAAKYSDAIVVVFGGEEGDDPSANARLYQAAIALPYLVEHYLLGTGVISHQWNDGYKELFGYFHPADIGLLGAMFVFGLIGLAIFAYQFRILWRLSRFVRRVRRQTEVLHYAIAAYLVYWFLTSIVTGAAIFWVEQSIVLLAALEYGARQEAGETHGPERTTRGH